MERLLTPVVSRIIRRFIKVVDGEDVSTFKVGFSGGKVVLKNLELRLDGGYRVNADFTVHEDSDRSHFKFGGVAIPASDLQADEISK
eukprot:1186608-Prorocentrum_minimum.AAC.6